MHKEPTQKGQILILLAIGLVALLAFVALALDGGMVYFDRRSAQSAADAAALAGAYEYARNPAATDSSIQAAGANRALDNGYSNSADGKTIVVVYYPPVDTSIKFVANDTNVKHYVRVMITTTVNTSFLHFAYNGPVKNTVEAVAHVTPFTNGNPFPGSGLVALAPHDCSRLSVGGTINANLIGGGIFVNSDNSSCAADGGSGSSFIYSPSMTVVGGISSKLAGSNLIVQPGPIQSPAPEAARPYPPDINLTVPTCSSNAKKTGTKSVNGINYDDWNPGSMNGFPSGNIYFEPGIYCISINNKGNAGSINNNQHFYNDPANPLRVLLVLTGTYPCNVTVNGGATLQLKGYGGDPYKGLLFFVDPGSFTHLSDGPLTFNGTSQSYINGTVYAPTCSIKLNGTGGNFYQGQVIGYDVTMTGTAAINMTYVEGDNLEVPQPALVDLSQ